MSATFTKERATEVSGVTAGISLIVAILGAILVEPVIIGVGAVGVAAAALVKLNAGPQAPAPTPTDHPMRRAEDQKREHEHVGA